MESSSWCVAEVERAAWVRAHQSRLLRAWQRVTRERGHCARVLAAIHTAWLRCCGVGGEAHPTWARRAGQGCSMCAPDAAWYCARTTVHTSAPSMSRPCTPWTMCGRLEWPVTFAGVGQPPLQRAHKITTPKTHSLTASAPLPLTFTSPHTPITMASVRLLLLGTHHTWGVTSLTSASAAG